MAKIDCTASLVIYGKVPELGWRRGGIVIAKNGLPKPGVMLISGREVTAPNFVFQIRRYVDRKAVYTAVGKDYPTAKSLLERTQVTRLRESLDAKLGIVQPKSALELAAEEADRQAQRRTLHQFAEGYFGKKKNLGVDSVALYRDTVLPFAAYCGKKFLEDVTGQDVVDWCDSLRAAGYAPRTIQTRYSTLRGFLRACGLNLSILIDHSAHRRLSRKPEPQTEPYTEEQIERLLANCDPYYRLVFTLLLSTGLRYREASHLTWRQIDWSRNKIRVEGSLQVHHAKTKKVVSFKTKTGKGRDVPLFASLKVMLQEWRERNPGTIFVFGTRRDLPDNHWLEYLKQYFRMAGLNCGMCAGCAEHDKCTEAYLHRFRHTYAHRCLEKFTVHQVSKWMGHHNISVTSIYLSGTPKDPDCDPFAGPVAA